MGTEHSPPSLPSAVGLKTPQRGDPDHLQRDGQDRPGLCGPGGHQAVHRPPVGEGHLQHLPVLPRGAHEGQTDHSPQMDQFHFCEAICPDGLYAGHTILKVWYCFILVLVSCVHTVPDNIPTTPALHHVGAADHGLCGQRGVGSQSDPEEHCSVSIVIHRSLSQ